MEKYRNKVEYTHDINILTTQVNIRQLQVTLDTYFTIPTSGNIWFT